MTQGRDKPRPGAGAAVPDRDAELFREAMRGTTRIAPDRRAQHRDRPPPVPVQSLLDAHATLDDSLRGPVSCEQSMEIGEELVFLRNGLARDVLRKLRRGHWAIQDEIDLHGLNRDQARNLLVEFLRAACRRRLRCLRIVHGKGLRSPGREPVLKALVHRWLSQREEVLAYCQAPANQGGGGALLVLLKG